jgi:hypothetical protein
MDFNPDQYDGPAAVADGANKLLMLVWIFTLTRLIIKRGKFHCNALMYIEMVKKEEGRTLRPCTHLLIRGPELQS